MNIIQYYDIIHDKYIISILYKYTGIYVIYLLVRSIRSTNNIPGAKSKIIETRFKML